MTNPNAPGGITNITPTPIGNGAVALTMTPPADGKTTGYEMTATNGDGSAILIPILGEDGNPSGKTMDAFAVPVTYPRSMVQDGKLTIVPDGSRLKLGGPISSPSPPITRRRAPPPGSTARTRPSGSRSPPPPRRWSRRRPGDGQT